MKQINGPGATVAFMAVLGAGVCAECIPVAAGLIIVALVGVAWDRIRGHTVDIKRAPREGGASAERKG